MVSALLLNYEVLVVVSGSKVFASGSRGFPKGQKWRTFQALGLKALRFKNSGLGLGCGP